MGLLNVDDESIVLAVQKRLNHQDVEMRCDALRGVFSAFGRAPENVISLVSQRLEDQHADVRLAAGQALASLEAVSSTSSSTSKSVPMREVTARLDHPSINVRHDAVSALVQVARTGDEDAITALCRCFEDPETEVASAAVHALKQFAAGDTKATEVLIQQLKNTSVEVRLMALDALSQVSKAGDRRAVSALTACLRDSDARVRTASVQTLPKIAATGDKEATSALALCIKDPNVDVRHAVVHALTWVAGVQDSSNVPELRF